MTRTHANRPRAAHLGPELRRPLVLDAALALFAQRGYDGVSMQAIADAAGVTKPVLYSCFASKDELFAALVRREDRRFSELMRSVMPRGGADEDDEDLLRRGLTGVLRAVAEIPDAFRVIYMRQGGDPGRVERGRAEWERAMAATVAARSASIEPRRARVAGRLIVAAAEIGFRTLLDEPGDWEPDALAAELARGLARAGA